MTRDEYNRLTAAIHEAGHAVIAVVLGVEVRDVTVQPGGGGLCRYDRQPHNAWEVAALATSSIAGPLAECHLTGAGKRNESPDDALLIHKAVEMGCDLALLREQADELVGEHWDRIELVALELFQRRALTGAQVKSMSYAQDELGGALVAPTPAYGKPKKKKPKKPAKPRKTSVTGAVRAVRRVATAVSNLTSRE